MLRVISHPPGPLPRVLPRKDRWRPQLDAAIVSAPGTDQLIERLHLPGALVVTTGQQPGLYTGPVYTIHKALAAAALARVLEQRWRRPVVPLFWIAGDDHDFAEASHASWVDAAGSLVDFALPPRVASAAQLPMSAEPLPREAFEGLAQLEKDLPPGPARDTTMAWLRRHYADGATLHSACSGALAELFAPLGILCFDPTHHSMKEAQAQLISAALQQATEIDAALASLDNVDTGIATGQGATLVFMMTTAGRDRLVIDGDGFKARRSGERFTRKEMTARVTSEPERFSANVLLRPVIESALLPTVAYVAGPAEMRYLEQQSSAIYPILGVERQVPVPRWSGSVVTKWADRLLGRLRITAGAVLDDDGTLARSFVERAVPGDVRQAIAALRSQIDRSSGVLGAAGKRIDPVLERAIKGRIDRLTYFTGDIEDVVLRHLKRRDETAYAQFARLSRALKPHGKLQERVLTSATWLGRYGDAWLAALLEPITAWAESLPADQT